MEKYLVLAQYVKTGRQTWWISAVKWMWKVGEIRNLSGSDTEVKIISVIPITDEQFKTIDSTLD